MKAKNAFYAANHAQFSLAKLGDQKCSVDCIYFYSSMDEGSQLFLLQSSKMTNESFLADEVRAKKWDNKQSFYPSWDINTNNTLFWYIFRLELFLFSIKTGSQKLTSICPNLLNWIWSTATFGTIVAQEPGKWIKRVWKHDAWKQEKLYLDLTRITN